MPAESSANRILVVDGDRDTPGMLRTLFEGRGLTVRVAYDGLAGLAAVQADAYALFIVGTSLTGLTCEEFVERLDQDPRTHGIPVMAVAPKNDYAQRVRLYELGVDDYLVRPLSPLDVLSRAQNLMRRPAASAVDQQGEVIVFIGCAGGVGTTTLCVNVAQALGSRASVSVVDAAWPLGAVSLTVNSPGEDGLQQLAASRGLPADLEPYMVGGRAGVRFRYLNGYDSLGQAPPSLPTANELLQRLCATDRYVLVDAGTAGSPFAVDCLREADLVVMVVAFERTHVSLARAYLAYLDQLGMRHSRRLIVGNRLRPSPLGVRDLGGQFEDQVTLMVPYEGERLSRCLNEGQLLVAQHPDSAGAIAIIELATTLTRQTAVQA